MPIKKYTREGILGANKIVTKMIKNFLTQGSFGLSDWRKQNYSNAVRYIINNHQNGDLFITNLLLKYGSMNIYLDYLIGYLKNYIK